MSSRHNLGTVIWFEFIRTIKKPSFWAATLSFPLIIVVVFAIVLYSGKASLDSEQRLSKERFSIIYQDDSKIVSPTIAEGFKAKPVANKNQAISDVKNQKVDAFFYYPANTEKQSIEIYAKDAGLFNNGKYDAVAKQILDLSANAEVGDKALIYIIKGKSQTELTTYKPNGEKSAGWFAAIPPLIFLVIFYFTIAMLGNNLLNSTVEEKENRVTEMILTTLNPTSLITGKIIATFMAGIVQAVVLLTPIIAAYFILGSGEAQKLNLPSTSFMSQLVIDPVAMINGLLIFIGGMLLFTGTLVAVGAIMPTAKEAGQWFGIAMVMMFIPFYILQLILSDPGQIIVKVFTFFPYTSPVTAMLRNAFGTLDATQSIIVIATLLVLGTLITQLAIRLFRYGAMEYSSKLSIRRIFK